MPVIKTIKNATNHYQLAVWEIAETKEELIFLLKKHTNKKIETFSTKNETLIKQKLATKLLLFRFFDAYHLFYDEKGKPFLNNGTHISISHSNNYVVVLLNNKKPCGVDIEKISAKVSRIKHKFLSEKELLAIDDNNLAQLTLMWAAKEALYKYYGKKEVIFNEHLFVENSISNKNKLKGIITLKNSQTILNLAVKNINDFVLVFTTS